MGQGSWIADAIKLATVGRMAVFHRGKDGDLWYNLIGPSGGASGDKMVDDVGISYSPSVIKFNNTLVIFHHGNSRNGSLWYKTYDGQRWYVDQQVPDTGISYGPSAIFYGGLVHVFHHGTGDNGELWENRGDGTGWIGDYHIEDAGTIFEEPAAVEYKGDLYVFYQGGKLMDETDSYGISDRQVNLPDHRLWYVVWSPSTKRWSERKSVPDTGASSGPSAVEFKGKLYLFHKGSNNDQLWYNVFDGTKWSGDTAADNGDVGITDKPGAILNSNGKISIFHQGAGGNETMWHTQFDGSGGWTKDAPVFNTRLSYGPSAIRWPF